MRPIVDAHLHFWDPAARHHDWLVEQPRLRRRFGPEDFDAGTHDLAGAVFVQADCREEEALDEVRWVERLAGEYPVICGVVAYAPVHRGRAAERAVVELAARPLVVGVRRLLQGQPLAALADRALVRGVRMLGECGLTFDLCVSHEQLPAVEALVRACPGTRFVLDHVGKPPVASGALDPWRQDLARLATHGNVACKLSGLATEAGPGMGPTQIRPYLEHALETFGPRRCMIGSDWPVATLRTSVGRWFDTVLGVVAELGPEDHAAVRVDTAMATYGLAGPLDRSGGVPDARCAVRR